MVDAAVGSTGRVGVSWHALTESRIAMLLARRARANCGESPALARAWLRLGLGLGSGSGLGLGLGLGSGLRLGLGLERPARASRSWAMATEAGEQQAGE